MLGGAVGHIWVQVIDGIRLGLQKLSLTILLKLSLHSTSRIVVCNILLLVQLLAIIFALQALSCQHEQLPADIAHVIHGQSGAFHQQSHCCDEYIMPQLHDRVQGPFPITELAIPDSQRLAVGIDENVCPLADPQIAFACTNDTNDSDNNTQFIIVFLKSVCVMCVV